MSPGDERSPSPLQRLQTLAVQEKTVHPGLRHIEIYTLDGLLSLLWHGDPAAERIVLLFGGAMGSLLGPAEGLYQDLGEEFSRRGIGVIRVAYRKPGDLRSCVLDVGAAADLASRSGGRRFVVLGHSFGGAVAVNAARVMRKAVVAVVTLATQSAGCEGGSLDGRPLLLLHGDRDELLPVQASEMVRTLVGGGELVVLPGTGHLLAESAGELRARLVEWIPARLDSAGPG